MFTKKTTHCPITINYKEGSSIGILIASSQIEQTQIKRNLFPTFIDLSIPSG